MTFDANACASWSVAKLKYATRYPKELLYSSRKTRTGDAVMTVNFLRRALKTATRFLRALFIQGVL
jgi:hypothetical protein